MPKIEIHIAFNGDINVLDLRVNGFWSGEVVLLIKSVCRSSKKAWLSKLNVWYIRGTGRGGGGGDILQLYKKVIHM